MTSRCPCFNYDGFKPTDFFTLSYFICMSQLGSGWGITVCYLVVYNSYLMSHVHAKAASDKKNVTDNGGLECRIYCVSKAYRLRY